jgi:hypothetical protein
MVNSGGDSMDITLQTVAATLAQLKADHGQRFDQVDQRFGQADSRLEAIEARIQEEGEKYRRHLDVLWDKMRSERNLVLDAGMAANTNVAKLRALNSADHLRFEETLTDHEARLSRLEK